MKREPYMFYPGFFGVVPRSMPTLELTKEQQKAMRDRLSQPQDRRRKDNE